MWKPKDLTGQRFGRLVAESRGDDYKPGAARWNCVCDCGKRTLAQQGNLLHGTSKSCGCSARERSAIRETRHGMSYTRLYAAYFNMKDRCYNRNAINWPHYGGRGITVCADWIDDVNKFLSWALAHGWASGLSLDRIDNNGNYSPDNCRWTDAKTQCRNKRNNKYVTLNGESVLAIELVEKYGVSGRSIRRWHENGVLENKLREGVDKLLQGVPQS